MSFDSSKLPRKFIALIGEEIHDTTFVPSEEAALRRAEQDVISGEIVIIYECTPVSTQRYFKGFQKS